MAGYVLTEAAQADIEDIIETIVSDDIETATRFVGEVYEAFELLSERPHAGHRRSDLTARPVPFWTVMRSFAIVYRNSEPLVIIRVVRWRRITRALLADEA